MATQDSVIKIRNLPGAIVSLRRRAGVVIDAADDGLRDAAYDVAELARAYVPIDEFNLQDAIEVEGTEDGYRVYIDLEHEPGTRADTVRDYALRMHEGVGYSGVARAGWPRGMKFMTRAGSEVRANLQTKIIPQVMSRIAANIGGASITARATSGVANAASAASGIASRASGGAVGLAKRVVSGARSFLHSLMGEILGR